MEERKMVSEEKGKKLVARRNKRIKSGERKNVKMSKVRTGCRTCKSRRVKCDENRPQCLRCQRIGDNVCGGYEFAPISQRVVQRPLAPLIAPQLSPQIQKFKSQDDICAFRSYCEKVAPRLSFPNDNGVWQRLLLQAGQENEFIQSAIYAIGGFRAKPCCAREEQDIAVVGYTGVDAVKLDKTALAHYGKFLEGTKKYISNANQAEGRRLAMIACLLIICIENMQYRPHNALAHAKQGLKLVEEISHESKWDRGGNNELETIETELMLQFSRLDLHVVGCWDVQSKSVHGKLMDEGTVTIRNMPAGFGSVAEAYRYLDLVMRRSFHFIAYVNAHHKAVIRFGVEHDVFEESLCVRDEKEERNFKEEIHILQQEYMADLRCWDRAYESVFSDILWNPHHPDAVQGLLMKVHSITTTLSLADHLSESEMHWDKLLPDFQTLVYLSKKILQSPLYKKGEFAFDMGLIYPLIILTLNCRERKTRREAIALLYDRPWREAHWDSEHAADVGKFVMQIEEEGVETDFIPEWARVRSLEMNCKMNTGMVHLICHRGFGDSVVRFECDLNWSGA